MLVLGLNCMHDAAAALVSDGRVLAAVEEERFTRRKHEVGFPQHAIASCLRQVGASIKDVDAVGVGWKPWILGRRVRHLLLSFCQSPELFRAKAARGLGQMRNEWFNLFTVRRLFRDRLGEVPNNISYVDHHLCHATSAFYVSPFERAAILTVDGAGEETTTMFALGEGTRIRVLKEIKLPDSLGQFYSAVTGYLGFKMTHDEYKVMGLAPYGEPRFAEFFRTRVVQPLPDGGFRLNYSFLDYHLARRGVFRRNALEILGPNRRPDDELLSHHRDVAASAQQALEETILHMVGSLHRLSGADDLCLAGGVAFNCVANGRLLREGPFRRIYVQPAAGDAGTALGAALAVYHRLSGAPRGTVMSHAYLGPEFSDEAQREALERRGLRPVRLADDELCRRTAAELAAGRLVCWFQGRMEWGPRALGNRSLLADPRRDEVREIINAKVKHRELFRPFAPSLIESAAGDFFVDGGPSPFMLFVFEVRPERRRVIPAVTHVDNTARPQTVTQEDNPRYWRLLKAFEAKTGVPVLLNTSFNVQEPIVCTPAEAVDCFLRTDVDLLVMGNFLVTREECRG